MEGPRIFFLAFLCQEEAAPRLRGASEGPNSKFLSRVPSLLAVIPTGVCGVEGPRLPGSPYSVAGANNEPEWSKAPDC